jgi:hypothetical protein
MSACEVSVVCGRRWSAAKKLLLLPPLSSRALDISSADTLHDLDRYSIGSIGVCGGGTASVDRSPWPTMP